MVDKPMFTIIDVHTGETVRSNGYGEVVDRSPAMEYDDDPVLFDTRDEAERFAVDNLLLGPDFRIDEVKSMPSEAHWPPHA